VAALNFRVGKSPSAVVEPSWNVRYWSPPTSAGGVSTFDIMTRKNGRRPEVSSPRFIRASATDKEVSSARLLCSLPAPPPSSSSPPLSSTGFAAVISSSVPLLRVRLHRLRLLSTFKCTSCSASICWPPPFLHPSVPPPSCPVQSPPVSPCSVSPHSPSPSPSLHRCPPSPSAWVWMFTVTVPTAEDSPLQAVRSDSSQDVHPSRDEDSRCGLLAVEVSKQRHNESQLYFNTRLIIKRRLHRAGGQWLLAGFIEHWLDGCSTMT